MLEVARVYITETVSFDTAHHRVEPPTAQGNNPDGSRAFLGSFSFWEPRSRTLLRKVSSIALDETMTHTRTSRSYSRDLIYGIDPKPQFLEFFAKHIPDADTDSTQTWLIVVNSPS